jgi:hypothetical protein
MCTRPDGGVSSCFPGVRRSAACAVTCGEVSEARTLHGNVSMHARDCAPASSMGQVEAVCASPVRQKEPRKTHRNSDTTTKKIAVACCDLSRTAVQAAYDSHTLGSDHASRRRQRGRLGYRRFGASRLSRWHASGPHTHRLGNSKFADRYLRFSASSTRASNT